MGVTEKIRIAMVKRGNISEAEFARKMKTSPQNLHNKLKRDNFKMSDLEEIAKLLDCRLEVNFVDEKTGEIL